MSCKCERQDMIELDSKRQWNPFSGVIEYTIFYRCRKCGTTWTLGNEGFE